MEAKLRLAISVIVMIALLAAGCSFSLPPNLPRVENTPTGTGDSIQEQISLPLVQQATNTPAVVTPTAAAQQATPTATPTAGVTPTGTATTGQTAAAPSSAQENIPLPPQSQTIRFQTGGTSYAVSANLQTGVVQSYQLSARNGQRMYITTDGDVELQVYDPNRQPISQVLTPVNPAQIILNQTGTYYIALQGQGAVTMSVYIPAPGANQNIPAPVPARLNAIRFQRGATSTSFTVNASPGTPIGYTLNVRAGQQMTVTTNRNATFTLLAPDGVTMVPSETLPERQWRFPLSQNGSYRLILLGSGSVNVNISIPALSGTQPAATPTSTPAASTTPTATATVLPLPSASTRVTFAPGNASKVLTATLTSGVPQAYVLSLQAGQTLYVETTGSVDVAIYGPGNTVLASGHAQFPRRWSAAAAQSGDYTFVISGSGTSRLTFYVPPLK
ncbi:MAG: hypothetical protein GX491_07805 [Chloroflexi bacterium]|nr:hypothetical protein [Chloroflexota bacterium]